MGDKKKKKKDKKNKRTRGRTTHQIIGAEREPVLSTEILSDAKDTIDLHTTMDNIGQEEFGYDASVAYDQGAEKSKKAKKDKKEKKDKKGKKKRSHSEDDFLKRSEAIRSSKRSIASFRSKSAERPTQEEIE